METKDAPAEPQGQWGVFCDSRMRESGVTDSPKSLRHQEIDPHAHYAHANDVPEGEWVSKADNHSGHGYHRHEHLADRDEVWLAGKECAEDLKRKGIEHGARKDETDAAGRGKWVCAEAIPLKGGEKYCGCRHEDHGAPGARHARIAGEHRPTAKTCGNSKDRKGRREH